MNTKGTAETIPLNYGRSDARLSYIIRHSACIRAINIAGRRLHLFTPRCEYNLRQSYEPRRTRDENPSRK